MSESSSSSAPINLDQVKRYTGEDPELIREVFSLFTNQVEMWMRGLDAGADDDMWVSIMHSLKGSARAVGADRLGQLCEGGETLIGDDRRPGGRAVAVERIEQAVEDAKLFIQRWEFDDNKRKLSS